MMDFESIRKVDPKVVEAMERELGRQRDHLELIASENFTSPAVMAAVGSHLTNKYAEGYPGKRYYGGCEYVDIVEELAIERAKELFGAKYANVQTHSGAQANTAVYLALLSPGDTLLGLSLAHGGHLTHGYMANFSGKNYQAHQYGVLKESETIDYDEVRALAREHKPKIIVTGASAYPRAFDFAAFREIADEVGAYFMVDMAHVAGLVAAGVHDNPVPYADIVTSTTHKTLRGPRGGLILCNDEAIAKKINSAVFPNMQGGPLMHVIAGKAVCFLEALDPSFKTYGKQVVDNADALAKALVGHGLRLVSGGTDNHLMLVDVSVLGQTGAAVEELLDKAHITVNKNTIPFDTQKASVASGIRVGTPAVTTRGLAVADMQIMADAIALVVREGEAGVPKAKEMALALCEKYPLYPGWERV